MTGFKLFDQSVADQYARFTIIITAMVHTKCRAYYGCALCVSLKKQNNTRRYYNYYFNDYLNGNITVY